MLTETKRKPLYKCSKIKRSLHKNNKNYVLLGLAACVVVPVVATDGVPVVATDGVPVVATDGVPVVSTPAVVVGGRVVVVPVVVPVTSNSVRNLENMSELIFEHKKHLHSPPY